MNSARSYLFWFMAALVASGCHRQLPEGIPHQFIDIMVRASAKAVKQCDTLLSERDCYHGAFHSGDRNKAVVLDLGALLNAPELRHLQASCKPNADAHPGTRDCEARTIDRGMDTSEECLNMVDYGTWPSLQARISGATVYVPEQPACKTPMVRVAVERVSPKGARFKLDAVLISKKWLETHPRGQLKPWQPLLKGYEPDFGK